MSLRHVGQVPATVAWGLFCACSWTWCIGMFLPIILVREFGWPGFLVFAVPNVLGCAAFGYVLGNAPSRAGLLSRHQPATVLFSSTVIGYHMFFAAYAIFESTIRYQMRPRSSTKSGRKRTANSDSAHRATTAK